MTTTSAPTGGAAAGMTASDERYGAVSIFLHWTIAALILTQIGLGWYMNEVLPDHTPAQASVQSLHISVGLTTLILILIRIGVRITHRGPPLRADMPAWEKLLARATHWLFYALMLIMPLTGWALVSSGHNPVRFWGMGWPRLPGVGFLTGPANRDARESLAHLHVYTLIWIVFANLFLHVAGALKHQFDGHPVLWRVAPFRFLKRAPR
ncbi:MAG: cytochrome b [Caulobacterales bacterium]